MKKCSFTLITLCGLLVGSLACNIPVATPYSPTVTAPPVLLVTSASGDSAITVPDPTATVPPPQHSTQSEKSDLLTALSAYQVTVGNPEGASTAEIFTLYETVYRLGESTQTLLTPDNSTPQAQQAAFTTIFGPTTIYLYPGVDALLQVHYGFNCGWEGAQGSSCQNDTLFPEQDFPEKGWLILFAGNQLLPQDDRIKGQWVVAHEFAHNLTWNGGHKEGFLNYVTAVGYDSAIVHFRAFGVQAGLHAYKDTAARTNHRFWQQELTADAIASWGLQDLIGPQMETVNTSLHDFMAGIFVE